MLKGCLNNYKSQLEKYKKVIILLAGKQFY